MVTTRNRTGTGPDDGTGKGRERAGSQAIRKPDIAFQMNKKYSLIILDFDGTLADSVSWAMTVISEVADKYGFKPVKAEDLERIRGYDPISVFNELEIPIYKVPLIASHLQKVMAGKADQVALHAGIGDVLKYLVQKGFAIAVVSSNSLQNVRTIMGSANMAHIDYFECGASFWGKRHKLKNVLEKSGFSSDEALYIGDEIRDLQAARKMDIAFGAVAWGFNRLNAFMSYKPDEIFRSVDDLKGDQDDKGLMNARNIEQTGRSQSGHNILSYNYTTSRK